MATEVPMMGFLKAAKGVKPEEKKKGLGPISTFMEENYKHFNAATVLASAKAYKKLIDEGGKMMISIAGAMSTGEIGISLAEMIRQGCVHAISCTGANLEEDVFNLIAHSHYVMIPNYKDLTPEDEKKLFEKHLNRVTDTCIPEKKAMAVIEKLMFKLWKKAEDEGKSYFAHEYLYQLLLSGDLKDKYEIDPKNSWMLAAAEKNIPIVVPAWEDSSLGNIFASEVVDERLKSSTIKNGIEAMVWLTKLYPKLSKGKGIGFFQIGGGCAGDFAICVVPLLKLDLKKPETPFWSYFSQISDSTTSYGSYSGAVPNEKLTWAKIDVETPQFMIESDAAIVCPLIFSYVLGR
jgi:deoxyhypusine synthase